MQENEVIVMPLNWTERLEKLSVNESEPVASDEVQTARSAASRLNASCDKEFSVRTIKGTGEVRAWRIK